jgi:hypothetical protein
MVVTNTLEEIESDAKKVVDAILAKRADPRTNIHLEQIYHEIASSYNGTRKILDKRIGELVFQAGLDDFKILAGLHLGYDNLEEQRRSLGSMTTVRTSDAIEDQTIVGSALEQNTVQSYLDFAEKYAGREQATGFKIGQTGIVDEGKLKTDFEREGLNRLDHLFEGL